MPCAISKSFCILQNEVFTSFFKICCSTLWLGGHSEVSETSAVSVLGTKETLKKKALNSSKNLVNIRYITWIHSPEGHWTDSHCWQNVRSNWSSLYKHTLLRNFSAKIKKKNRGPGSTCIRIPASIHSINTFPHLQKTNIFKYQTTNKKVEKIQCFMKET